MARGDMLFGVQAYWSLDEASGNRADSVGSNTLTDHNTVTSGTGLFGNAALFTAANSEYLTAADAGGLRINGDFSVSLWLKPASLANGFISILDKRATGAAGWNFAYTHNTAFPAAENTFFGFGGQNSSGGNASAGAVGPLAVGTWTHVVGLYEASQPAFRVIVNGVDDQNGSPFANTGGVDPSGGTETLYVGCYSDLSYFFDGYIDQVIIWNRLITAQDATDLYNGGAGLPYPFYNGPQTFRRTGGLR